MRHVLTSRETRVFLPLAKGDTLVRFYNSLYKAARVRGYKWRFAIDKGGVWVIKV